MDARTRTSRREATAKIRNIAAIPVVLRELGGDVELALRRAGLDPLIFSNSENVMPYAALGRLMKECVARDGLRVFRAARRRQDKGERDRPYWTRSLHSPTVREALQVVNDTLRTSETGGATSIAVHDDLASFIYAVTAPNIEAVDQIEDGSIAIAFNLMRQICGSQWRPHRVRLSRSPPRDKTPFVRFFEAPVDFAEACSCLVFDIATLDEPVRDRRPDYVDVLAPLLEEAAAQARGDFLSAVRLVIRSQIGAGALSRDNVCRALNMSARTLANRLESYGVSYSGLSDDAAI